MQRTIIHRIILAAALPLFAELAAGCAGLDATGSGKYFHCERNKDIRTENIRSVGVYVFSDGPVVNAESLEPEMYPPELRRTLMLRPDSSNKQESAELAHAIKASLEDRGYRAPVMTELGHSGPVGIEACLENARSHGMDAVFITYYTGISPRWKYATEVPGASGSSLEVRSTPREGYLYLPNSALFDARTGDILWSNSYYGVVENAHFKNVSNEGFIDVVPEAVISSGGLNYIKAAPKAAKNIFAPPLWPDSFREFPARKSVTKGS